MLFVLKAEQLRVASSASQQEIRLRSCPRHESLKRDELALELRCSLTWPKAADLMQDQDCTDHDAFLVEQFVVGVLRSPPLIRSRVFSHALTWPPVSPSAFFGRAQKVFAALRTQPYPFQAHKDLLGN